MVLIRDLSKEELRNLSLGVLREYPELQFENFYNVFRRTYHGQGILDTDSISLDDKRKMRDILWDLFFEGIIRPGSRDFRHSDYPHFHVTDWGSEYIKNPELNPYDPFFFVKTLRDRIQNVDEEIITYLEESMMTFRIGTYLSSTVMLGCASEKANYVLINAYTDHLQEPQKTKFISRISRRNISDINNEFYKRYTGNIQNELPDNIADGMDIAILSIFNLIRRYRNDAGHPKNIKVSREEAFSNLRTFVYYLEKIYEFVDWLRNEQHQTQP